MISKLRETSKRERGTPLGTEIGQVETDRHCCDLGMGGWGSSERNLRTLAMHSSSERSTVVSLELQMSQDGSPWCTSSGQETYSGEQSVNEWKDDASVIS